MTKPYYEISLENLILRGNHGVFPQERTVGNDFQVDLKVAIPMPAGIEHDELDDTISYADLYDVLKSEFDIPSRLLEHVCLRVAKKIRQRWPLVQSGEIKIVKLTPPIPGFNGQAAVKNFF